MTATPAVGVLGGTFDPVHLGHLEMAETTRHALHLERVLLLPAAIPPHKPVPRLTSARHRETMLRLAVEGRKGLDVSTLEIDSGGVCYTIDSLRRLRTGPPACSPVFVMGGDSLLEIHTWRDYRELLREFDLAVLDRPGSLLAGFRNRLEPWIAASVVRVPPDGLDGAVRSAASPAREGRIYHVRMDPLSVSSTEVRRRAAAGESLDGLVPPSVARYIRWNLLYRQEDRS